MPVKRVMLLVALVLPTLPLVRRALLLCSWLMVLAAALVLRVNIVMVCPVVRAKRLARSAWVRPPTVLLVALLAWCWSMASA